MRAVEVTIDDRWFLPIPGGPGEEREVREQWAARSTAELRIDPGWEDAEAVERALVGFSELADPAAIANLLYCPDGLPGRAIVSVYGAETDLESLEDLVDELPASLPRQVLPFRDRDSATARVISSVRQLPDGTVLGILQYQQLRDGAFVEAIVTSPSLPHLGAGMPLFEELVNHVTVAAAAEAGE